MLIVYWIGVPLAWPLLARACYRAPDTKDDFTAAVSALGGFLAAWLWPLIAVGFAFYWTPTALRHTLYRGIK